MRNLNARRHAHRRTVPVNPKFTLGLPEGGEENVGPGGANSPDQRRVVEAFIRLNSGAQRRRPRAADGAYSRRSAARRATLGPAEEKHAISSLFRPP